MNIKYDNLDDNFFKEIKTDDKSYLLGWIVSNGKIEYGNLTISINKKDKEHLIFLKNIICSELPIIEIGDLVGVSNRDLSFIIPSKIILDDIYKWLNIRYNNGFDMICFPNLETDELKWSFIRGIFDGNGSIFGFTVDAIYTPCGPIAYTEPDIKIPNCKVTIKSNLMRKSISQFTGIPCDEIGSDLCWVGNNCLDFLNKIYENSSYSLMRKYNQYLDLSTWVPSISYSKYYKNQHCIWSKTREDAVSPSKERASDSGYDLVLLEKIKTVGKVEFYDTGIKIKPNFGYYFNLVPRSFISKTGYILANSIGVIDRTYLGNIIVALIKIDDSMPDLVLPSRLVQIIPTQIVHFQLTEVDNIDINSTNRSDGGFGSSNK